MKLTFTNLPSNIDYIYTNNGHQFIDIKRSVGIAFKDTKGHDGDYILDKVKDLFNKHVSNRDSGNAQVVKLEL